MLRRHKNSNTRRLGNVEQKNIFFGCSKTQMLADIERWSEWGSMFPHFPKYQSGMLIDYFACSWVVFQVWCSCLVLRESRPSLGEILRCADWQTRRPSPLLISHSEGVRVARQTAAVGKWLKSRLSLSSRRCKKIKMKKWKKQKIFKAVQQWGKVLEPGTETAFGIRAPCLFGIHCQGPSEEM